MSHASSALTSGPGFFLERGKVRLLVNRTPAPGLTGLQRAQQDRAEVLDVLGEQPPLLRGRPGEDLLVGLRAQVGPVAHGQDVVAELRSSAAMRGREHLVQQQGRGAHAMSRCWTRQASSALGRGLIGVGDLRVDLVRVVSVIADGGADPAWIDGEYLGGGVERGRAAFVDLAQELDDLPDVRAVGQRRPSAGRPVLEDHARVVGHPQALVDQALRQSGDAHADHRLRAVA